MRALTKYETLADVPQPFDTIQLPAPLTPDEDVNSRVARSGATGSTIVEIPPAEQTEAEKTFSADGTRIYRTQAVRVFADTTRVYSACASR